MIAPAAANPDQVATPRARWSSGKAEVIVLSVPGMIIAAPTPITRRQPMSTPVVEENAAASDAAPNTSDPAMSTLRRPMRSPSAPSGSTRAARATV